MGETPKGERAAAVSEPATGEWAEIYESTFADPVAPGAIHPAQARG
jgi:hypothetical protein